MIGKIAAVLIVMIVVVGAGWQAYQQTGHPFWGLFVGALALLFCLIASVYLITGPSKG